MAFDFDRVEDLTRQLLHAIGEDPTREGLRDTPRRVAAWWRDFMLWNAGKTETSFARETVDQMVVVSGMRVWSLCEHHLLPFWCDITVGYITNENTRVLGLSKFGRIAKRASRRLQIQERLVAQIADDVQAATGASDVGVLGIGEHLCMTMRGVEMPARMASQVLRGAFKSDASCRAEFMSLADRQKV